MSGSITVTVDDTLGRVGVQLSGWSSDGPVAVKRAHTDGTTWAVREHMSTSGGLAFTWDYEAPRGESLRWTAMDGATRVESAPAVLASTGALLRIPGRPGVEARFEVAKKPTMSYPRQGVALEPFGRETVVPLRGARSAGRFAMAIETRSAQDAQSLREVAGAPTALLIAPGTLVPWAFVDIADMSCEPVVPWLSTTDGDAGSWYAWSLSCAIAGPPAGGLLGDPTASFQVIRDKGWTFQDLLDWKGSGATTMLDVVKGGY